MKSLPYIRYIGLILAIVATLWFGYVLFRQNSFTHPLWREYHTWTMLFQFACIYAVFGAVLAGSWLSIISLQTTKSCGAAVEKIAICALTQIYKYLPSNTLHLVGRHSMFVRLGYSHKYLIVISILEQVLLAIAAITVVGYTLIMFNEDVSELIPKVDLMDTHIVLGALVVFCLMCFGVLRYRSINEIASAVRNNTIQMRYIVFSFSLYVLFFFGCGVLLYKLGPTMGVGLESSDMMSVVTCFSVAWLLGNFTPGSPAGMGVRETVLLLSLDKILISENNGLVVLGFRVVTLAGDFILAFAAYMILTSFKKMR